MEFKDLPLLFQLINGLEDSYEAFAKAYNSSDKVKFDSAKEALLEFQKKIDLTLK